MTVGGGKTIAIFGTSKADENESVFHLAYQLGRQLAAVGFTIANGGYGGTMRASAQGAASAGGRVVGVTCRAFRRSKANDYVTEEISTDSLDLRLTKLVELGYGYAVLPGGTGTLLELAHIWEHKNKGFEAAGKPIVVFRKFWEPVVRVMAQVDPRCTECITMVDDVGQAVDAFIRHFQATIK
jgi:uncharacterized protein (TIGR00730 family)